jgi:hypothetical protein
MGYWHIIEFVDLFPGLQVISALVGGMSVLGHFSPEQRPLCFLVDMGDEGQKDKASELVRSISLKASTAWERVRSHSKVNRYDHRLRNQNGLGAELTKNLMHIGYHDCCRSVGQWKAEVELLKCAFVADGWEAHRGEPQGQRASGSTTKEYMALKHQAVGLLPCFRQVFLLRIYDREINTCGLEEVTL